MLGLLLGQNGDVEEAIVVWRRALALQPERAHSLANLGLLLTKNGRSDEGVDLFRRAIALRPEEFEYHKALGLALWNLKDVSGAHDAYVHACALAPDDDRFAAVTGTLRRLPWPVRRRRRLLSANIGTKSGYGRGQIRASGRRTEGATG